VNDLPQNPPSNGESSPEITPRMEGRIRACEGILRAMIGKLQSDAGSRAIQQLRGETLEPRQREIKIKKGTQRVLPITQQLPAVDAPAARSSARLERPKSQRKRGSPFFAKYGVWGVGAAAALMVASIGLYLSYVVLPAQAYTVRVGQILGSVQITTGTSSRPAVLGEELGPGQKVSTGVNGYVLLVYRDGTALDLPGESLLTLEESQTHAKSVLLAKGTTTARVRPQPSNAPMTISTSTAKVEVVGTAFTVAARPDRTELDVEQGKVRLTRNSDEASIAVGAGFSAIAADGVDLVARKLQFVKGVNLGGRSVTIDGKRWLSYKEALADGLSVPKLSQWDHPKFEPTSPPDAETRAMLQSGVFTNEGANDGPLILKQNIPNGEYKVFIWSNENSVDHMRNLTVYVQGMKVASGISSLPKFGWGKYGPYTARVTDGGEKQTIFDPRNSPPVRMVTTDGTLTIEIQDVTGNHTARHLCGFAIYKVN
jgi:ferric-dicitrate binding protein FerR (iron transport regulator)